MSYTPTNWIDEETPVNAENLNKIERALQKNSSDIDDLQRAAENNSVSWDNVTNKPFYETGATGVTLEEQEFPFSYDDSYGFFTHSIPGVTTGITAGATYTVVWDGVEYVREAFVFSTTASVCVAVGNPACSGAAPNDDPFAIVYRVAQGVMILISADEKSTHTVGATYDTVVIKTLEPKFLPMDTIDARIDEKLEDYISAALEGDY